MALTKVVVHNSGAAGGIARISDSDQGTTGIGVDASTATAYAVGGTNATSLAIGRTGMAGAITLNSGGGVNIQGSGATAFSVNSAGTAVGVLTSSPNEVLEIAGNLRFGQAPTTLTTLNQTGVTSGNPANGGTLTVASSTNYPTIGTILIDSEAISYTGKTGTTFTGVTRGVLGTTAAAHTTGASIDNYLKVTLASATTPRMVILGSGKHGIGTTLPGTFLHVKGTGDNIYLDTPSSTEANLRYLSNGTQKFSIYKASDDSYLGIYNNATSNTVIAFRGSNDRVGIGTTNPNSTLHLKNASGNLEAMRLECGTAGNTVSLRWVDGGTDKFSFDKRGDNAFGIYANALSKEILSLQTTNNGRVGILTDGASGPDEVLHVGGTGHIKVSGTTPTIANSPSAGLSNDGTGGVTVAGSDTAGILHVTTGNAPASGSLMFRVTFATAFTAAPKVIMLSQSGAAPATDSVTYSQIHTDKSTTNFGVFSGPVLPANKTFELAYIVIA